MNFRRFVGLFVCLFVCFLGATSVAAALMALPLLRWIQVKCLLVPFANLSWLALKYHRKLSLWQTVI